MGPTKGGRVFHDGKEVTMVYEAKGILKVYAENVYVLVGEFGILKGNNEHLDLADDVAFRPKTLIGYC